MDSILDTVKKSLGIDIDYQTLDANVINCINTVLTTLNQIGVGPTPAFAITGDSETWVDFLGVDPPNLASVQDYVTSQVRTLFDPLKTGITVLNPNSILDTIKKMLGLDIADDAFDIDVLVDINSVLMTLNQIGVGPAETFSIVGRNETWGQFFGTATNLDAVKSYIYLKVRMLFDPPLSSAVVDAINRQITEFESRLNMQAETGGSS